MPSTSDSRVFEQLVNENPKAKKVLAEGDSWLAYPRKYIVAGSAANIVDQLSKKRELLIYSSASNGDEAVAMLSGEQKFSLLKRIQNNQFDYLLFSGGGNDIVGRYDFDFLIRKMEQGMTWRQCINDERLALKIKQLEGSYCVLCELVADYSTNPAIKIVTHTYDLAIPDKTGFELFDIVHLGKSWMYPYLVKKDINIASDQREIVALIMIEFKKMLLRVQDKYSSILKVIDTQGTLTETEWRNEIHPTPAGFKKVAEKIYSEGLC